MGRGGEEDCRGSGGVELISHDFVGPGKVLAFILHMVRSYWEVLSKGMT